MPRDLLADPPPHQPRDLLGGTDAAGKPAPEGDPTIADSLAFGVGQGLTFNTSDEIEAGIRSGLGLWGDYGEELDQVRANMEAARKKHPWLFLGGEIGGGIATGAGLAKGGLTLVGRTGGSGIGKRALAAGVEGAGYGAAYGAGAGESAEDRAGKAATGAAFGAALGPVAEGVGSLAARAIPGKQARNMSRLNPVARKGLEAADEFGVPLTRGQATGDLKAQAFEQAARHGAKGRGAERAMSEFGERQAGAIQSAQDDVARGLGGTPTDTPYAAGEAAVEGIRSKAGALKEAGGKAYEAAKGAGVSIDAGAVQAMPQAVRKALEDSGAILDPSFSPVALRALKVLDDVAELSRRAGGDDGRAVAMSLEGLDAARKKLVRLTGANADDIRNVSAIKKAFDGWIEDAVDNQLFSGDAAGLAALKKARGLWSQYLSITRPKKGDDAGQVISKMASRDIDPVEATNWLLGVSNTGASGRAVRVVKRLKGELGEASEPVQTLRQAMWLKLTRAPEGKAQPGAQKVASAIGEFTSGKGSALARELFTRDELAQMGRFAMALRATVPDAKATNPSKSGYRAMEALNDMTSNIAGMLGFAYGDAGTGIAARLATPLLRGTYAAGKARRSISTPVPGFNQLPGATAAGGQLGQKAGDQAVQAR